MLTCVKRSWPNHSHSKENLMNVLYGCNHNVPGWYSQWPSEVSKYTNSFFFFFSVNEMCSFYLRSDVIIAPQYLHFTCKDMQWGMTDYWSNTQNFSSLIARQSLIEPHRKRSTAVSKRDATRQRAWLCKYTFRRSSAQTTYLSVVLPYSRIYPQAMKKTTNHQLKPQFRPLHQRILAAANLTRR